MSLPFVPFTFDSIEEAKAATWPNGTVTTYCDYSFGLEYLFYNNRKVHIRASLKSKNAFLPSTLTSKEITHRQGFAIIEKSRPAEIICATNNLPVTITPALSDQEAAYHKRNAFLRASVPTSHSFGGYHYKGQRHRVGKFTIFYNICAITIHICPNEAHRALAPSVLTTTSSICDRCNLHGFCSMLGPASAWVINVDSFLDVPMHRLAKKADANYEEVMFIAATAGNFSAGAKQRILEFNKRLQS